jgi:outer membrane protein
MKQRLVAGVVVLVMMVVGGTARAEMKLAYVDVQRALNECRNGREAKTQFRGRIQRLQSQLESEQNEVERLKHELEQKGALMQPDQRQTLEDSYSKKLRQFQDDYKNSRDELQQKDNEMTGAIVRDLATVVRQLGEKNDYTMVMEKGSLLWASPSIDITDQVIRTYDAMNVRPGTLSTETASSSTRGHFGSAAQSLSSSSPETTTPPSVSETGGRSTVTK